MPADAGQVLQFDGTPSLKRDGDKRLTDLVVDVADNPGFSTLQLFELTILASFLERPTHRLVLSMHMRGAFAKLVDLARRGHGTHGDVTGGIEINPYRLGRGYTGWFTHTDRYTGKLRIEFDLVDALEIIAKLVAQAECQTRNTD